MQTMLSVAKHQKHIIGFDSTTEKPFLLFDTTYEGQAESPCIELPYNAWRTYLKEGNTELESWIKRIDEDYQVGRFSKDNPRLFTDYQLATDDQKQALMDSANTSVSLVEQEAIRILSQTILSLSLVPGLLHQKRSMNFEVFCLGFRFFYSDKPLLNDQGETLLEASHNQAARTRLENSPLYESAAAAEWVLGAIARSDNLQQSFVELKHLQSLIDLFNFRYLRDELKLFIEKLNLEDVDETEIDSRKAILIQEFRDKYPGQPSFHQAIQKGFLPHWFYMEQALAWESSCRLILNQCFLKLGINLDFGHLQNILHLPCGHDGDWHGYSTGQSIKYCNEDPAYFTQETVAKPGCPFAGYEDYLVNLWQHYFRFFMPKIKVSNEDLYQLIESFMAEWEKI